MQNTSCRAGLIYYTVYKLKKRDSCLWLRHGIHIYVVYASRVDVFAKDVWEIICVCACMCAHICVFPAPYTLRRHTYKEKIELFFQQHFTQEYEKGTAIEKCSILSLLSVLFLMKDWILFVSFSTLGRKRNIKMLNFWKCYFYSSYKKTITCNGECILSKKINYHSSSTMQSCKLWHYLCWHKGKKWRRKDGLRWRWGTFVGNKEKRANPYTNTRPSA